MHVYWLEGKIYLHFLWKWNLIELVRADHWPHDTATGFIGHAHLDKKTPFLQATLYTVHKSSLSCTIWWQQKCLWSIKTWIWNKLACPWWNIVFVACTGKILWLWIFKNNNTYSILYFKCNLSKCILSEVIDKCQSSPDANNCKELNMNKNLLNKTDCCSNDNLSAAQYQQYYF